MKKSFTAAAMGMLAVVTGLGSGQKAPDAPDQDAKWKGVSFYTLKTTSLEDKPVDFSTYGGKVTLVVNVASKCGYTPQYKGLEAVWNKYKDQGLVIIGFPSNDFGLQEPGSAKEIQEFCAKNFGVTFPLMAKCQTKAGKEQSPIFGYLGARTGMLPSWNFSKYLIGRDGQPIAFYKSGVTPEGEELTAAIEAALKAPAAAAKGTGS
jgi:glutathione peroxidase